MNSGVPPITRSSFPSVKTRVIPKSISLISSYPGLPPPKQRMFSGCGDEKYNYFYTCYFFTELYPFFCITLKLGSYFPESERIDFCDWLINNFRISLPDRN